jgi:hypothetical protein
MGEGSINVTNYNNGTRRILKVYSHSLMIDGGEGQVSYGNNISPEGLTDSERYDSQVKMTNRDDTAASTPHAEHATVRLHTTVSILNWTHPQLAISVKSKQELII